MLDWLETHVAAKTAYQAGMSDRAAEMYDACVKQAETANHVEALVHSLRWKGNSLMWAGQHQQAQAVLLEATSFIGHPQARTDDLYGALTDFCLLSLQTQPYQVFSRLLQDTRAFIEKLGLSRWRHRTDNLEAIACYRRGLYREGLRCANRAWHGAFSVEDGIRYQWNSYLYYMFRSAHGLTDLEEVERAMGLLRQHAERCILTARLRLNLCEMLRLFLQDPDEQTRGAIVLLAEETLTMQRGHDPMQDEEHEATRMLAVLGQPDKAELHLNRALAGQPATTALLRLDIALSRLAGVGGWIPPHLVPPKSAGGTDPASPPPRADFPNPTLPILLHEAEQTAAKEDQRMECSVNSERVRARHDWLLKHTPQLLQADCARTDCPGKSHVKHGEI